MSTDPSSSKLVVRRYISATPARVFAAWTDPDRLVQWWGPVEVTCTHADVDLVIDGRFRLGNRLPDGSMVWINGQYKVIDRPSRLEHTWIVEADGVPSPDEYVVVDFAASGSGTDVTITHTKIGSHAARQGHEAGWHGCLDGLEAILDRP